MIPQSVFNHFYDQHDLALTETEYADILHVIDDVRGVPEAENQRLKEDASGVISSAIAELERLPMNQTLSNVIFSLENLQLK